MTELRYRIGTVSFAEAPCPTWENRSLQILEHMARWGREGWRISRLNGTPRIRLRARGFCVVLESAVRAPVRRGRLGSADPRRRERAA